MLKWRQVSAETYFAIGIGRHWNREHVISIILQKRSLTPRNSNDLVLLFFLLLGVRHIALYSRVTLGGKGNVVSTGCWRGAECRWR
jgi:hypothetical protein